MRTLLFSALLALAAATVIPAGESQHEGVRKPGMCFGDYIQKHGQKFENFKNKSPVETSEQEALQHHNLQQSKEGPNPYRDKKPCPKPDFSKLKNCSVDWDCDGEDKCCSTKVGMRCTKAIFEEGKVDTSENHRAAETEKEQQEKGAEQKLKPKRDHSEEEEDNSEESESEEGSEGEQGHEGKREKRSEKENLGGKGKGNANEKGKGEGKGKGREGVEGHGKGKGKGKGREGDEGHGKGEGKGKGREGVEGHGKGKGEGRGKGGKGGKGQGKGKGEKEPGGGNSKGRENQKEREKRSEKGTGKGKGHGGKPVGAVGKGAQHGRVTAKGSGRENGKNQG
ncbi:high mobility group nucleosome-binding domain-containing protein 5-like isoform X2 [Pleurodeles waltl]|uniref:high mobility group nucleosome-binding domain-containing protein 5-like isoform X2 n=1 Tax=Pleurodeles waltl TaxID=8319 RepID=UPI003709BE26